MAQTLPYLPSYKNVGTLFDRILAAKKPDALTHTYLQNTLGLKGSGDRALISFLRSLGFLDAGNRPTSKYDLLKNPTTAKRAIAEGVRSAYKPLFDSDENAHQATGDSLRGLIAQVAGTDDDMTKRIAMTFSALAKLGDFSAGPSKKTSASETTKIPDLATGKESTTDGLRPEFHYNIQIHLPGNGTEETYLNIFNALRRTLK